MDLNGIIYGDYVDANGVAHPVTLTPPPPESDPPKPLARLPMKRKIGVLTFKAIRKPQIRPLLRHQPDLFKLAVTAGVPKHAPTGTWSKMANGL